MSRQQSLDFVDGAGTLSLDNASSFHATISHFSGSAEIDLAGFDDMSQILFHASASGQGGTLTITDGTNHSNANLHFAGGGLSTGSFQLSSGPNGSELLTVRRYA